MQSYALLTVRAHSGIHAGSGQEYGVVDLPIQRERTTNYPVLLGPSFKGALRQEMEENGGGKDIVDMVFGPETSSDYAGALCVGDARLVLFPMRSMKGTFALTTCPLALRRLKEDIKHCGLEKAVGAPLDFPEPTAEHLMVCGGAQSKLKVPVNPEMVVLEDYGFQVDTTKNADAVAKWLSALVDGKWVEPAAAPAVNTATTTTNTAAATSERKFYQELLARLAILPDDYFQNFVTFATEVVTRIHLDKDTKTVLTGQLWTEELLPAASVLVSTLACSKSRKKQTGTEWTDKKLLGECKNKIPSRIQIGGNETVGYGICYLDWLLKE